MSDKCKYPFLHIPMEFFRGEQYLLRNNYLDEDGDSCGVTGEKLFATYVYIQKLRGNFDSSETTLRSIANTIGITVNTNNIRSIRNTIRKLKSFKLLDYDFDIDKIGTNDNFEVLITRPTKNFKKMSEEEFRLLGKLGMITFLVYSTIKSFEYNGSRDNPISRDEDRYCNMSIANMTDAIGVSSTTFQKHINKLYSLGIIDIQGGDYQFSETRGEAQRTSHRYYFDLKRASKVIEMSKQEIEETIEKANPRAEKEFMRMSQRVSSGYCSGVAAEMIDRVMCHMDNIDKFNEVYEGKIVDGGGIDNVSKEYINMSKIYAFSKVAKKKARIECMKLKFKGNESKIKYENEKEIAK